MSAEKLVLGVLAASPGHKVEGKKRLQKLSYFAHKAGAGPDVKFFLHDYGPFSTEVAKAADMLCFLGAVQEEDRLVGKVGRFACVYSLESSDFDITLPENVKHKVIELSVYSTIELEIASTIHFFMDKGEVFETAIASTKSLKPSKSQPVVIEKARRALAMFDGRQ